MKRLIFWTALVSAALISAGCEQPSTTNSANKPANANANTANTAAQTNHEADVKKLLAELAGALAKNDADAAAKFYSDDYHLVNPQGVDQDRSARMSDMKGGSTKFDSFAYENVSVRSYGDTAVAIADVNAKGMANGQPLPGKIKTTLVLHKAKDGWKVVSGQATPVTATAAPAANGNTASSANK